MSEILMPDGLHPTVYGTGLIGLDVILNGTPEEKGKLFAGGTCGNVLAILSFLGWRSYPLARLKNDWAGRRVVKDLGQWGVCLDHVQLKPRTATPIIVERIKPDHAGGVFHSWSWTCPKCKSWLPGHRHITIRAAEKLAGDLRRPKVFFLDRVSPAALKLARVSRRRGAAIVFEPSAAGPARLMKEAIKISHLVKYSHSQAGLLSDIRPSSEPPIEVVTYGEHGLRFRSSTERAKTRSWQHLQALKMPQPRDTAGAGDWCSAGIIHFLCRGGHKGLKSATTTELRKALRFGQALAAWNCQYEGARGGMYYEDKGGFQVAISNLLSGKTQASEERTTKRHIDLLSTRLCPQCGILGKAKGANGRKSKST